MTKTSDVLKYTARNYILDDAHNIVQCVDPLVFGTWFGDADSRRVGSTSFVVRRGLRRCGVWVSTVFLVIDHNFSGEGDPVLFETLVSVNGESDVVARYCTWDQAEVGHNDIVRAIKGHSYVRSVNAVALPKKYYPRQWRKIWQTA
jgi:hypothetical protein